MIDVPCKVVRQVPLTSGYWVLELQAEEIARAARPGQFVHVRVPGLERASLRRPFSIFGAADGVLKIMYKTVGRGTGEMSRMTPGEELQVIGPLGNGFPLTPQGVPVLVAGGYGVAPLCFLASRLPDRGVVVVGGRTAADVLMCEEFERMGWAVRVATQDGSRGARGLVTAPLDCELARLKDKGASAELYACGPDGMLKAVCERALTAGCRGWLSLDKHMVCGVGACLACVQNLRRPDGTTWIGRVCNDGPIFEASEIVW